MHSSNRAIGEAQLQGEGIGGGLAVCSAEELEIFDGAGSQVA